MSNRIEGLEAEMYAAVKAEREACAQAVVNLSHRVMLSPGSEQEERVLRQIRDTAAAIRARGDTNG